MSFLRLLPIALLLSASTVTGRENLGHSDCANLLTTGEQKECAEAEYKSSGKDVDAAYVAAVERVRRAEASTPGNPADKRWAAAVAESQRAWEIYRDAECRGVVGHGEGSGRMVLVLGCLAEKNRERTRELKVPYYQR